MATALRLAAILCLSIVLTASRASAGPALLFEAKTGKLLYGEDIDDHWHPASVTKIMTAYLTFEAVKAGKLTLETKIGYSQNAFDQPPSKIGMPVGAELMVDVALRALIIKSANDIAVALAEAVGGSEAQFIEMMNAKAKQLGMTRTRFVNPHGLPAPEQVTTARDLAKLSRAVVRDYPEHNHYWSMHDMRIGRIRIGTHNSILKNYVGADGLKTGFICDSGYNVVASATRDGLRLMAVVLGESTGAQRAVRAQALLEHGFNTFAWKTVFSADTIDTVKISPTAKDVESIRTSVMATECGNRRRAVKAIADARARAKQRQAAAQQGTGAAAEGATAPAPKAATAKAAAAGTAGSAGAGQAGSAAATTTQAAAPKPKPKPKPPAMTANPANPAGGGTAP